MSQRNAPYGLAVSMALFLAAITASHAAGDVEYLRTLKLPAQSDSVAYPKSVAADLHTGEIFVCDARGNRILIFDEDGLFDYEINGGTVFRGPRDIAVDPEGLYAAPCQPRVPAGDSRAGFRWTLSARDRASRATPPESGNPTSYH